MLCELSVLRAQRIALRQVFQAPSVVAPMKAVKQYGDVCNEASPWFEETLAFRQKHPQLTGIVIDNAPDTVA